MRDSPNRRHRCPFATFPEVGEGPPETLLGGRDTMKGERDRMPDKTPITEKSKEETKRQEKSKPVEEARKKVNRHLEEEKPGPGTERVEETPQSDPSQG